MEGAYVLAVVGESPAVLSELLWWLCVVERRSIAGIEAWGTGRGVEHLVAMVGSPAWSELQRRTGPLPPLQPEGSAREASHGFRVHAFRREERILDDVRSEAESACVSATLHDRLRDLRSALPVRTPIVGGIAGGRKTVSAALQTAFCLQAGASDRLVHSVLHSELETRLRETGQMAAFAFPAPEWEELSGVPEDQQLVVYDVAFPRLRYLVPRRLSEVIERLPWDEVWPTLDANMGRTARGVLRRTGIHTWTYEVVDAESGLQLYSARLRQRAGAVLAAMVHAEEDATTNDLVAWLDKHEVGWVPPKGRGSNAESRANAVRGAASTLRRRLEDIPVGLERFAPADGSYAVRHVAASLELP